MKSDIGKWLEKQFIAWQMQEGESKTIAEFASYLGISRSTLNKYMNGERKPDEEKTGQIATKLGPEIYDVLKLPRPDPRLQAIIAEWGSLSDEEKEKYWRMVEKSKNKKN